MKVTNEKTETRQVFLTIEMEPQEVEESLEKSYRRLVKKANVPGFRKGKAPRAVLERHIGKKNLFDDALENLIPEAYEKALKEQNIEAYAQPDIELTQTEPVIIFKAVVPLPPKVELGDYHQVRLTPQLVEITEDNVKDALEELRHRQATWEPVERPVKFDDLLILDVDGKVEGSSFFDQKGIQYRVLQNLVYPAPGFAEQLIDMKIGEEKEFTLGYPENYPKKELAGKEASFKVKVAEIKEERLPEINDEFAKAVGAEFTTLDALRERLNTNLKLNAEENARLAYEEQVIQAIADISQIEFPPVLVEGEIDRLINQQLRRFSMDSSRLPDYLRLIDKSEQELRDELRPLATKRITQSLVLSKVAEDRKIEVADAEIDTEIEKAKSDAEKKEELHNLLNTPEFRRSISQVLLSRKTMQQLVEVAKGSNQEAQAKPEVES